MTDIVNDESLDSIKNYVAGILESADSSVRAQPTRFFNNTYAPDLVLTWASSQTERPVYLRTTTNPSYLEQDLGLADDQGAILMPLAPLHWEQPEAQNLNLAARESRALVAEVEGFAGFEERRKRLPVVSLASRALLQGGSGAVSARRVVAYSDAVANGFESAQVGNIEGTRAALENSAEVLFGDQAHGVENFLHAVWLGAGGLEDDFPGPSGLNSKLDTQSLNLLLESVEIEDDSFWKRIAINIQLAHLQGLEMGLDHGNFQRLLAAAAPKIKARAFRIVDEDLGESRALRWFARQGSLGLVVGRLAIVFNDVNLKDLEFDGREEVVSLPSLRERSQRNEVDVTALQFSTGTREFSYTSSDGQTVVDDPEFLSLSQGLEDRATVSQAVVTRSGPPISIDFGSSTARTGSAAKYLLADLVSPALPLMVFVSSVDAAALDIALGDRAPNGDVERGNEAEQP